jgi:rod shape-determining protein MreC|tara:strand:- start:38 stop:958 length:921 start_codon:yes stop_codon:yes gene_type:complete
MNIGSTDKTIFVQGPYLLYRLLMVVILSIALIFLDTKFSQLDSVRRVIGSSLTPIYWLSALPENIANGVSNLFTSRESLQEELDKLESQMLVLERKAQKLASVTAELNRLRELLNASRLLDEGVVVTEMIAASPNPDNQYIQIDKGLSDGVYLGQAVLDAHGLMGQVIGVNDLTSRVLLISDSRHAVPVQINRNGLRAIAYGVGAVNYIELGSVPATYDIKVGDLLVSSGLGGRFPEGYPVGRVSEILIEPGESFAQVRVTPEAQLNRSKLLLIVFQTNSSDEIKTQDQAATVDPSATKSKVNNAQ